MIYLLKTITFRLKEVRKKIHGESPVVVGPHDIGRIFKPFFRGRATEAFVVAWLDASNTVIGYQIISEGILNSSLVHPREVFRGAITHAPTAAIVLMHNHPSGNPKPSVEDIRITRQLVDAGKILGIPVHDHVILPAGSGGIYTSFAERGLL